MSRRINPENVVVPDLASHDVPEVGARAEDRETDAELVVVDVFPRTAAFNHVIDGQETVAAHNEDYDPRAPVAECVYTQSLGESAAEADIEALLATPEFGDLRTYHFPVDRLRVLGDAEGGDDS